MIYFLCPENKQRHQIKQNILFFDSAEFQSKSYIGRILMLTLEETFALC